MRSRKTTFTISSQKNGVAEKNGVLKRNLLGALWPQKKRRGTRTSNSPSPVRPTSCGQKKYTETQKADGRLEFAPSSSRMDTLNARTEHSRPAAVEIRLPEAAATPGGAQQNTRTRPHGAMRQRMSDNGDVNRRTPHANPAVSDRMCMCMCTYICIYVGARALRVTETGAHHESNDRGNSTIPHT